MKIKLAIDADLDAIPLLGVSTKAIAHYCQFSDEDAAGLELAVVEAVTNSVKHAQSQVSVSLSTNSKASESGERTLEIEVQDQGPEYHPDYGLPDSMSESGYGLFLVSSICEEVRYRREQDCNYLSFRKSISST